jgi:hypothetical protein
MRHCTLVVPLTMNIRIKALAREHHRTPIQLIELALGLLAVALPRADQISPAYQQALATQIKKDRKP